MDSELPLELAKMYDETTPQRDGTYKRVKVYVFYVGRFGPYTERVASEGFDELEFGRRVEAIRSHLRTVQR
jgi:hypothetical protein